MTASDQAADKQQISLWLPRRLVRWLRVTAAARDITRSQLVTELVEEAQRGDDIQVNN